MADNHQIVEIEQEIAENPKNIKNSSPLITVLNENSISPKSNKTKKQKLISKYFPTKSENRPEPCTNINNMNDDCLSELFRGQFTLQQLMQLRAVCTQWQALIEQLFAGKRFLKIFIKKDTFLEHFRTINQMVEQARMERDDEEGLFTLKSDANGLDDVLVIKNLCNNLMNLTFISTLFPSVTNLLIVFPTNCRSHGIPSNKYHSHTHFRLCDMLAQWPKLGSLSLKNISHPPDNSDVTNCYNHWFGDAFERSLWPALPQLSSLHLFGKTIDIVPVQVVLKQLKRLTIVTQMQTLPQQVQHQVELLPHLKQCTRLISIGSYGLLCDECLTSENSSMTTNNTELTHLTLFESKKYFIDFRRLDALTYLDINLPSSFQDFFQFYKKLANLTELRVKLIGLVEISNYKQLAIDPNKAIPVLSSVAILHLGIFHSYILQKESPPDRRLDPTFLDALPQIFPNLKEVKLITISKIVKTELETSFKSRGPNHFPLLRSVQFLPPKAVPIDLDNYDGPYRELLKSI